MEKRYGVTPGRVATRGNDGDMKAIYGVAAVYYDGTSRTEYPLWEGAVERILPGAFARALDESTDVLGLFNHDTNMLLGRTGSGTMRLEDTPEGLAYEIEPSDTSLYRDLVTHLRRGDVSGSSFGFRVTDEAWIRSGDSEVREIRGVELFDVGPVVNPAYTATSAGARMIGDLAEARASFERHRAMDRGKIEREAAARRLRLAKY